MQIFNLEPFDELVPLICSVMAKKYDSFFKYSISKKHISHVLVDNYFYCVRTFNEA